MSAHLIEAAGRWLWETLAQQSAALAVELVIGWVGALA